MRNLLGTLWRRYRALPGRVQAATAVAAAVVVVIAAAVGGANSTPTNTVGVGKAQSTATSAASTITTAPPSSTAPAATSPTTAAIISATPQPPTSSGSPGTCHVRGSGLYVLPDPACTPGATNPDVTQADISSTICSSGWTATIRPPESYTEPIKIEQMTAYGDTGPTSSYEEDHLISLELGGSPRDPHNLWPEPGASPNPKDKVENAARSAVCDGRMTLPAAQQAMSTNWIALGRQLGVIVATPVTTLANVPATTETAPPPTSPAPPSASGCSPTTSSANCYKRGEYCPSADHGMTGTDANGNTIICEDVNGTWRWE